MKRRNFIGAAGGLLSLWPSMGLMACSKSSGGMSDNEDEREADVVIAGGGLGSCGAALAALRNGRSVIMTEETDWIGGQLTQQAVPPDEHQWIETQGATQAYRTLRNGIRSYYRDNYRLTAAARSQQYLNIGNGSVSRLCCEPKPALAVLSAMLQPYVNAGKLTIMTEHKITSAEVDGDRVRALVAKNLRNGDLTTLTAPYFVDGTELGDLLPLTGTEHVTGSEAQSETKEMHAAAAADPLNQQAFTVCFALCYDPSMDWTIAKPAEYDFWRNFVPEMTPPWSGRLFDLAYSNPSTLEPKALGFDATGAATGNALNLWVYRRIIDKNNFEPGSCKGDVTMVNWPQNDYFMGNIDTSADDFATHVARAKQLNLSLLYWLQTEVPRPDGGQGWPGLRLRSDIMGTADGMAKYPYIREARRIRAMFTILEEHVGKENRKAVSGKDTAAEFHDSVGVGYYHIDLHPTTKGNNYIDFNSLRYQIPLGALIPQRMENLMAVCKNIGTTHITNGCYRLHPIEWNIGESAGMAIDFALAKHTTPRAIREDATLLADFQQRIQNQGIQTAWQ